MEKIGEYRGSSDMIGKLRMTSGKHRKYPVVVILQTLTASGHPMISERHPVYSDLIRYFPITKSTEPIYPIYSTAHNQIGSISGSGAVALRFR